MEVPAEIEPLCRELDRERPQVLVVVGAGVSFGATGEARASWRGLLEHGVETLCTLGTWNDDTANANLTLIRDAFTATFDLDEVLGRAESIAKALGAPDGRGYADWLAEAIGSLKAVPGRTATLDAIRELEQAGALILTTNYDDLLGDATGLDPVTWQDHREFLRVLNREREGILHLHGHWRQPSSVILGRRSYESILTTPELQDIFKSIWLHWSWLYVGCGNGLDDPNVGRLLRWGHEAFGGSARKHYFLAQTTVAHNLASRPDKPANLDPVAYADHAELPSCLRALTPRCRPQPFVELGPESGGPVRLPGTSPLDIPLPSWQELLDGKVPALAADADVAAALRSHGWALVYDVASVGKTTLALRLAAGAEYRDRPAFYLDLAHIDQGDEDQSAAIRNAVRRLAQTRALVILDNAQWAPRLVREAWEWWLARPRPSRLLLLATRIQHTAGIAGDDALAVIDADHRNPPIAVRPAVADLTPIVNAIVARIRGGGVMLHPPDAALVEWHATYHAEMGAFAAAVTGRHHGLARGEWALPRAAAAEWMRNRHLARPRLNAEEQENLVCLSVFAVQALELDVAEAALPHPDRIAALLRRGLVERRERGMARYLSYRLREPDWGALLLAAVEPSPDAEYVLLATACRHALMVMILSSRLFNRGDTSLLVKLQQRLDDPGTATRIADQLTALPLTYAMMFLASTARADMRNVADRVLDAFQAEPARLAARAFETPLHFVASLIGTAAEHKRDTLVKEMWAALEADPSRLAERAFETPLGGLASFIGTAAAHERDTLVKGLWMALEADPARLAERAFETPLHFVASFIETAAGKGRVTLVEGLWAALEADPARLAERAFETPLGGLSSFIGTAAAHERDTLVEGLWAALEADLARLAARAFETPLDHLATFIRTAAEHKRDTLVKEMWAALEADPARLAERAFETPLDHLATFTGTAAAHKRDTLVEGLWAALEAEPARLQISAAGLDGSNLRGFLLRAPEAIGRLAIAKLDVKDWAFGSRKVGSFPGAPRLATQFATLGRNDLAAALRDHLLRSADPLGYQVAGSGILDVAILLNNMAAVERAREVDAFVTAVCTPAWLTRQYRNAFDAPLAGALVLLGVSQTPVILRRSWSPALTGRIGTALAALASAEGEVLGVCVAFLGAAQLIGQRMPRAPFAAARLDRIARLPIDVLPHRATADEIEPYQRNLWLGLRAVATLAPAPLPVGQDAIAETLARWRVSLQESAAEPTSTCHRLNGSMVAWLEACTSNGRGELSPCLDPLWLIPGFGWDPTAS